MLNQVSRTGLITLAQDAPALIACDPNAIKHYITVKRGTATAGSLTFTATPASVGSTEPVYYSAAPLVHNLATTAQATYTIENTLDSISIACSGSNGTWSYSYRGA